MAAATKKPAKPRVSERSEEPQTLSAFWKGQADNPYTFARFYWGEGAGGREGVSARFLAKRRPVEKSGEKDTAARVEVLLPTDAPEEYSDPDFLTRNFDARLSEQGATAYVQLTMRFPEAFNLHGPYERCRSFLRNEFVDGRSLPVLMVLHAPHLTGSPNAPHIHALILPREIGRFGFGNPDLRLGSDRDREETVLLWEKWVSCR